MLRNILIGVIIFIAVFLIGYGAFKVYSNKKVEEKRVALFMTDGKVYFGFLSDINNNSITLNDVYYLKTGELQSNDKKILLVKMGNELHGPESQMVVNREQVLFWQRLTDSSKINDAIARFNQPAPVAEPSVSPAQ